MNNIDLLRQYVDTGRQIPEYQVRKLSGQLLNTYIRKRIIACEQAGDFLEHFELDVCSPQHKETYLSARVEYEGNGYCFLRDNEFGMLNDAQRHRYLELKVDKCSKINSHLTKGELATLTPDLIPKYAKARMYFSKMHDYPLRAEEVELLTHDQKIEHSLDRCKSVMGSMGSNGMLSDKEVEYLPQDAYVPYLDHLFSFIQVYKLSLTRYQISRLPADRLEKYIKLRLKAARDGEVFYEEDLDILNQGKLRQYFLMRLEYVMGKKWPLYHHEVERLPPDLLDRYNEYLPTRHD